MPTSPRPLVVTNDFLPTVGGIQAYLDEILRRLPDAAVFAPSHPDAAAHDADLPYPVHRVVGPPGLHGPGGWMLPTSAVGEQVRSAARAHGANVVIDRCLLPG